MPAWYVMLRAALGPLALWAVQWSLLVDPAAVTTALPALCPPVVESDGGEGAPLTVAVHALSRVEAFDLGVQVERFTTLGCAKRRRLFGGNDAQCDIILSNASNVLGAPRALSPAQLSAMREELRAMDARRSGLDRVLGFLSFVNLVWVVSIVGIVATVVPVLAFLLGEPLQRLWRWSHRRVVLPLHRAGALEPIPYMLLAAVSAQAYRYPAQHATAASMWGLLGGMGMLPCWVYTSFVLFAEPADKGFEAWMTAVGVLTAGNCAPLAVALDSRLIGFFALGMLYVALGFVMGPIYGMGFYFGFNGKDSMQRCQVASLLLVVGFATMRVAGVQAEYLRPFASGVMVLGNINYFLALLIQCMRTSGRTLLSWRDLQITISLGLAMLVGSVYGMPAASNVACTFFVLWAMQKQLAINFGSYVIVVVFLNFVGLFILASYLSVHPHLVTSLFDPKGMYV